MRASYLSDQILLLLSCSILKKFHQLSLSQLVMAALLYIRKLSLLFPHECVWDDDDDENDDDDDVRTGQKSSLTCSNCICECVWGLYLGLICVWMLGLKCVCVGKMSERERVEEA